MGHQNKKNQHGQRNDHHDASSRGDMDGDAGVAPRMGPDANEEKRVDDTNVKEEIEHGPAQPSKDAPEMETPKTE